MKKLLSPPRFATGRNEDQLAGRSPVDSSSRPVASGIAVRPVTAMQAAMLWQAKSKPSAGIDIEQLVLTLDEKLDEGCLAQAWEQVASHHQVLRSGFEWGSDGAPSQHIYPHVSLPIAHLDWCHLERGTQDRRFAEYLADDRSAGFDLQSPPLQRLAIFRTAAASWRVLWTFHHVILDGRSIVLLLDEIFAVYQTLCKGGQVSATKATPFSDFLSWYDERDALASKTFWQDLLRGCPPVAPLPVEQLASPPSGAPSCAEVKMALSRNTTGCLAALAGRAGATMNTVVQGAWALLMARYSGEPDVLFAATRACRKSGPDGADTMVGPLINTLPIRVNTDADTPLFDYLQRLRETWVAMRPHEHTPLSSLLGWAGLGGQSMPMRSLVVFEHDDLNGTLRALDGAWANREIELIEKTVFPLTLGAYGGDRLRLTLGFHLESLEHGSATAMLEQLCSLLEDMARARATTRLRELRLCQHPPLAAVGLPLKPVLPTAPNKFLETAHSTEGGLLHDAFRRQALRTPEAPAVRAGHSAYTYAEFDAATDQLARHLRERGLREGDAAVVCQTREMGMLLTFFAVLKAGGVYVPVSPADPPARLRHVLDDTGARLLLTSPGIVPPADADGVQTLEIDADALPPEPANALPEPVITPSSPAYIIYTSGSTGRPKGVVVPHGAAAKHCSQIVGDYKMHHSDVVLVFTANTFDPFIEDLCGILGCGASIILRDDEIWSPERFHREALAHRVTFTQFTPSYLHECLLYWREAGNASQLPLRLIVCGGDVLRPETAQLWQNLPEPIFGLCNVYGPTETTISATIYHLSRDLDTARLPLGVPIGQAVTNKRLYVLDPDGRLLPHGVPGELWIGGSGHATGYLNCDDLTRAAWRGDSTLADARMYRSGDRVVAASSGDLHFLGRIDNQIKIRGFRIELGEVEAALRDLPGVADAAASVSTKQVLRAHLIGSPGHQLDPAELMRLLHQRLPAPMVPAAVQTLATLPLTPHGKLDRRALAAVQIDSTQTTDEADAAPASTVERKLLTLWREILAAPDSGACDDFFQLGGHSLLALRLIQRVNREFGTDLPLATVFKQRTVRQLAAGLMCPTESARDILFPIREGGSGAPAFFVHGGDGGALFYEQMLREIDTDRPVFAIEAPMLTDPTISEPAASIEEVAASYVERLLAQPSSGQKGGNYLLGGYSFGGLAALEMARQLAGRGHAVDLVLLIDTANPAIMDQRLPFLRRARKLWTARDGESVTRRCGRIAGRLASGWVGRVARSRIERRAQDLTRRGIAGEGRVRATQVNLTYSRLAGRYRPEPYSGRVVLLRAEDQGDHWDPPPDLGWRQIVGDSLEIQTIPGAHLDLFDPRNISAIATTIEAELG